MGVAERPRGSGEGSTVLGRLPDFVMIGAQRSGTTSLAYYLKGHPALFIAPQKEVHFFDERFDKGIDWYRDQFAAAPEGLLVGEATPSYMYSGEAMERMASTLPDARLLAILRNPVDRAYSHYWLNRSLKKERLTFPDAIAREGERIATDDFATRKTFSYVDRGRYLRQLQTVAELYPRDRLHVVIFEDMRADPSGVFAGVCRFLGVEEVALPRVGDRANPYVEFHSLLLKNLSPRLPRPLRKIAGRINRKRTAPYTPMDDATRAQLVETFRADNQELARWLGRDLSAWDH